MTYTKYKFYVGCKFILQQKYKKIEIHELRFIKVHNLNSF